MSDTILLTVAASLIAAATALGLSSEQVDNLFILAATL